MKVSSKLAIQAAILAGLGCLISLPAFAQASDYPNRPVTIILPVTPGGAAETITRVLANKLAENWGQPVILDPRPGAGGSDRHGSGGESKAGWLHHTARIQRTLLDEVLLAKAVVRHESRLHARDAHRQCGRYRGGQFGNAGQQLAPELIAYLKANPGKANFGSGGIGLDASPVRRTVQEASRCGHRPYSFQGRQRFKYCDGRRPDRDVLSDCAVNQAACGVGPRTSSRRNIEGTVGIVSKCPDGR